MNKKFQQFIYRLMGTTLIIAVIYFVLRMTLPENIMSPAIPWLILMFLIVTATIHYILLHITAMNPRKFVGYFMLSTFTKLLIYLIVIVAYIISVKEGLLSFVLAFFLLYVIYTVFEVVFILKQTKE